MIYSHRIHSALLVSTGEETLFRVFPGSIVHYPYDYLRIEWYPLRRESAVENVLCCFNWQAASNGSENIGVDLAIGATLNKIQSGQE